jgi:hypothetical protein
MYFNLDREKKQKILNYYKQEATDSRRKKETQKKLKIQDELNFLHEKELEELESEKKAMEEQTKKKKALMQEYLQMLQKTKNNIPGYHFQRKNKEVILKNWGKSKEESLKENTNDFNFNKNKNNSMNIEDNFNSLSQIEKARQIIKPIDHMNQFLTDEQNLDKVNLFFMQRKNHKRDFYKNLLFSQHEQSNQLNKDKFGTEDILILKQKKKNLISDNPYRKKYQISFNNSTLENNPILNPRNNIRYNKYFKELYQNDIKQNINNMFNSNDLYYNKNNNFTIERTHNNMVLTGNNVINSFDKKDKMVRNFSGILNNDLPKQNNEFNYDKELNLDNINNTNNKILSNRSMSQKII